MCGCAGRCEACHADPGLSRGGPVYSWLRRDQRLDSAPASSSSQDCEHQWSRRLPGGWLTSMLGARAGPNQRSGVRHGKQHAPSVTPHWHLSKGMGLFSMLGLWANSDMLQAVAALTRDFSVVTVFCM